MSFGREQVPLLDPKDMSKEFDLLVPDRASLSFDVGQDVACHVTPEQLQLSGKFLLSPLSLITKLGDVAANYIFVAMHMRLPATNAVLYGY